MNTHSAPYSLPILLIFLDPEHPSKHLYEVLIIVNGHGKARALRHGIEESVSHIWTISALQLHQHGIVVCDEDATAELKVGTYKYFKDIEGVNLDPSSQLK